MKFDTKKQQMLLAEQRKIDTKVKLLYLAKDKERAMNKAFRGIQSFQSRKRLFQIGQKRADS